MKSSNSETSRPTLGRAIEHAVGLLSLFFLALGLLYYALSEPQRIVTAQAAQLNLDLDGAMTLYAENCSLCHGLQGEGIGATPALNTAALKESDPTSLVKIISRGLFNTAMPAWSKEDGGPLSDYQIATLVALIQYGNWDLVQDRVVNLGLAPLVPFTTQPDPAILDAVIGLPDGDLLSQGITLYAEQCVACHGADGVGTSLAPALNDSALRAKGANELERIILNGVPGTLMASWKLALEESEVSALLALLLRWEEVPVGAIPAPDRPVPVTEESLQLGASLYSQSCSRCHGPEGQGTQRAPSLNVRSFLEDTNDVAMQQIITLGVSGTAMPAWGDRLTDAQIQAIVGFIRAWEPTAPEVAVPTRSGGPWWATGGSRPAGASLPSGGVQQPTQPSSTVQPAAGAQGEVSQGAGAGQNHQSTPQAEAGSGGPPWADQGAAAVSPTWDWQKIALLGGSALLSLLLIGSGLVGLIRLRKQTA
jgi:mono/diheme cytochrome c family protein